LLSSTGMHTPGAGKYPRTSRVLASCARPGWFAIAAEIRSHGVSEASGIIPRCVEICLVVAVNEDGLVRRNAAESFHFIKNLVMAGDLLQLVAYGAGAFSIDNRRSKVGLPGGALQGAR
jgi:hypothetical protein